MDPDDVLPGLQTREGTNINHTRRINGTSINLLRTMITSLTGARNPHVLRVHSGFCAPFALYSRRSRQFIEVLINKAREAGKAQMTLPCLGILVEHP